MRKLLQLVLKSLSKAVIRKYNPTVIGITGSVGKTSTKEAIFAVLKSQERLAPVRASDASFNNEIGFPMAILGLKRPGRLIWILNILRALKLILIKNKNYPKILVLEMGADKPGDIEYLVDIAPPQVGVVTGVGEIPVHVEYYSGPEEVAKEKSKLVQALPALGLAILNHDDEAVYNMKGLTRAGAITFGFDSHASVWASGVSYFFKNAYAGLVFKLNHGGKSLPFRLPNALGRHQIYTALAAAAAGIHFGINLIEVSRALEKFEFPKQRMKLLRGIKNSWIIDDSYNASPLSTHAALDTLKEFGDKIVARTGRGRKIAVLGDMRELGVFTEKAHRLIGNLAGEKAEFLFTVGPAAKFIADSAFNQLPKENIMSFDNSTEAGEHLKKIIQEGDIVLVKGSRAMNMEKIVEALT